MGHYLKFWGTRGSCPVSGPQYSHFGGNTSCLEIRYGEALAIIDAGTGILPLGNRLLEEGVRTIHLFFSHMHWDHLIGFPFFKPLYRPDVEIQIHVPEGRGRSPKELFEELFAEEFFPVRFADLPAGISFHPMEKVRLGDLTIEPHLAHHVYTTYCFKITTPLETIGYATDNEVEAHSGRELARFFCGCDLFVHEMQYTEEEHLGRKGWGHSSPKEVLPFVEEVAPKRWIVTHHDPDHTDADLKAFYEETRKKVSCPVEWIHDGATIELRR